ncbi:MULTISPECIES: hypothetical protein [unclassified Nocardioides]|uniref:hypothetical protein n=1 Tax=unclassified Nocardioides TaxID=2615069 RepID=UPI0018D46C21|nr:MULTISPECIES: hypothetical protein [unclassified Nocardioides]
MTPTSTASLRRAVVIGAVAGVIASVVMAMYAMLAAYTKDTGFFTPMYHIASLVTDDADMMKSMMADQQSGDAFTFLAGPAILGAVIHMMTGAAYGAAFGAIAHRLRLGGATLAGAGLVYGFLVFALSAYVALPIAAAVFGSGDPIENMAEMAGWGTFIVEHLIFGVVLGVLVAVTARTRTAPARTAVPAH